jgi:mannose-1-phosphate guanylyltransferase
MHFVILCGGSGSRLWPKSREKLPKQFLKLTNNYTMLQNTILRIFKLVEMSNDINNKIYIICNKDHGFIVNEQINELELSKLHQIKIITEPKGRDSAPAVCISSLLGSSEEDTFIMPCDHIFDDNHFCECALEAYKYLDKSIVTYGIKPTHAETGFGYIEFNENNKTLNFVEKPSYETALKYVESGNFLWNAGVFIFKNRNMISLFEKYAIDILENCRQSIINTDISESIINLSPDPFSSCRALSVDYAIMEYLVKDNSNEIDGITILYNSSWSDIGSYSSLYNECVKDENNNVLKGDIFIKDVEGSYIETCVGFTSVIGLDNIIVVNDRDSLLICNKDNSQDVKKIIEHLKENKRIEALYHSKVFRPWGWYINIEGNDNSGFKVKRIAVYPGKRLSLQSHNHRSEHWVIVKGNALVQVGNSFHNLTKNDHIYIPLKELHRIENTGTELMEFTETQIGDYLGEDDIIRYEDDFGRI